MKNLKNQKGITLIALIITIIVMLILVAVTINVALNGGLFSKADDSALKTEKQSVYEQTVAAMVLNDNGDFMVNDTGNAAVTHFTQNGLTAEWNYTSGTNSGTLTVHGKRGTYEIEISAYGIGYSTSSEDTGEDNTYAEIAGVYKETTIVDSNTYYETITINEDGTGTYTGDSMNGNITNISIEGNIVTVTMNVTLGDGENFEADFPCIFIEASENGESNRALIDINGCGTFATNLGVGVKGDLENKTYKVDDSILKFGSDGMVEFYDANYSQTLREKHNYIVYDGYVYLGSDRSYLISDMQLQDE